jgi:hypothetical protein
MLFEKSRTKFGAWNSASCNISRLIEKKFCQGSEQEDKVKWPPHFGAD